MAQLRITGLPDAPLDAAAAFHGEWVPRIRLFFRPLPFTGGDCPSGELAADNPHPNPTPEGDGLLVLIFPPADHTHRSWRLAAVQELAREFAPRRVNGLVGDEELGLSAALALLEPCQGITGQLLALDGTRVV